VCCLERDGNLLNLAARLYRTEVDGGADCDSTQFSRLLYGPEENLVGLRGVNGT